MPEKPKLKKTSQPIQVAPPDLKKVDEPAHFLTDANEIPLMFQAQIPDRGEIQYVEQKSDYPKYQRWVDQWLEGCPPRPEVEDENIPIWKRRPTRLAVELPNFGSNVKKWEYQIRWRIITNSGQDGDLIRPIIGAKGIPFFPGSSMKGAFRQACPEEKQLRYCGSKNGPSSKEKSQPGILRFHGGYPIDMAWAEVDRLVDITHGQQPYQVMRSEKNSGENANILISLYRPKLRFGISCSEIPFDSPEWGEIEEIWRKALSRGIGSRVSAGYGFIIDAYDDRVLLSVNLHGQGVMSQLLLKNPASNNGFPKTPEFRPNMMKAVLRGHTLRILGGLTDEATAKLLVKKIWGGIPERCGNNNEGATVGLVGINFSTEKIPTLDEHIYTPQGKRSVKMPIYNLRDGRLSLIKVGKVTSELEVFLIDLVRFSMLLGGYGKSWRRASHEKFYPSYFKNKDKPAIGCHWQLADSSQQFLVDPGQELAGITNFIEGLRNKAVTWIESEINNYQSGYVQTWREAWHPSKVQVWGRISSKSAAIRWFHGDYRGGKTIYKSNLAGEMGKIGRIWHRMYPQGDQYIEFLTVFPEDNQTSRDFLEFLTIGDSGFKLLWGDMWL